MRDEVINLGEVAGMIEYIAEVSDLDLDEPCDWDGGELCCPACREVGCLRWKWERLPLDYRDPPA